jgi:hypothetical protein
MYKAMLESLLVKINPITSYFRHHTRGSYVNKTVEKLVEKLINDQIITENRLKLLNAKLDDLIDISTIVNLKKEADFNARFLTGAFDALSINCEHRVSTAIECACTKEPGRWPCTIDDCPL